MADTTSADDRIHRQRAVRCVERRERAEWKRRLVRGSARTDEIVAREEPSEHRDTEVAKTVGKDISKCPSSIGVAPKALERPERDADDAVERSGADELRELPIDSSQAYDSLVFQE